MASKKKMGLGMLALIGVGGYLVYKKFIKKESFISPTSKSVTSAGGGAAAGAAAQASKQAASKKDAATVLKDMTKWMK